MNQEISIRTLAHFSKSIPSFSREHLSFQGYKRAKKPENTLEESGFYFLKFLEIPVENSAPNQGTMEPLPDKKRISCLLNFKTQDFAFLNTIKTDSSYPDLVRQIFQHQPSPLTPQKIRNQKKPRAYPGQKDTRREGEGGREGGREEGDKRYFAFSSGGGRFNLCPQSWPRDPLFSPCALPSRRTERGGTSGEKPTFPRQWGEGSLCSCSQIVS